MIESANATSPNSLGTSRRASTSVAPKTSSFPAASAAPAQTTPLTARRPRSRIGLHDRMAGVLPGQASVVPERVPQARHQPLRDEHPGDQRELAAAEGEGVERERLDRVAPGDGLVALDRAAEPRVQAG